MEFHNCCFRLLKLLTCLVTLVEYASLIESSSAANIEKKPSGPVINVTKHLSFPSFRVDHEPRIAHDLNLLGNAELCDEKGAIQIPAETEAASDLRHQAGRALYAYPVRLLDPLSGTPASFETTFSFQFSKYGFVHEDGGSGLTFIIVPDEFTVGRPGGWLAMLNDACQDNYKAVAIEFDTRQNPEFGDPNGNHVGINLGSIVSTTTINASDVGISLGDGSIHRAWIAYNGPRRWMEVSLGSKTLFSGFLDISPFLNEYMFVGFSASTGNHTQIHKIFSWNFTSTSQASLRVPSEETCESKIIRQFDRSSSVNQNSAKSSTNKSKPEPPNSFLIFIAVMGLVIAVFFSLFYNGRRRRAKEQTMVVLPDRAQRPRPPNKPHRFTFSQVSCATRYFNEIEVLGNDSRGVFYRGKLPNGCQVTVKRFSPQFLSSVVGSDRRRMLKEIKAISRNRHPNLVPIRGWCQEKQEVMVIYDFYTNGSLDKWLFGAGVLPWTRRFKVIKDVADALHFLHSKQLAHKNMKASSVFLDVNFRAVLGDFGFVNKKRLEAAVAADVFEFGVFALEVVKGRSRVMESEGEEEEEKDLVEMAWRMQGRNEKGRMVDRRMGSVVNMEEAIKVVEIGLVCTLNGRPSMEEVVQFLNMERSIPALPGTK